MVEALLELLKEAIKSRFQLFSRLRAQQQQKSQLRNFCNIMITEFIDSNIQDRA